MGKVQDDPQRYDKDWVHPHNLWCHQHIVCKTQYYKNYGKRLAHREGPHVN